MLESAQLPRVVHRACGGWLAFSAPNSPLKIGVTAETEDAVRADYEEALAGWLALLAADRA